MKYYPVRIQENGYIMLGRRCWHRESVMGRGGFGPPLATEPRGYVRLRAARAVARPMEDGAVLAVKDRCAVAVFMFKDRRPQQERRLNYWRGCYGEYKRLTLPTG